MDAKLSILICSLPKSKPFLDQMLGYLGSIPENVELLIDDRNESIPTGQKRNDLIEKSQGEYFVFVDCDDKVESDYIAQILQALESNPDCVPIDGWYVDVLNKVGHTLPWEMRIGHPYDMSPDKKTILRWPNHLAVMKKSLVQHIKFPHVWRGEDYEWSKRINDLGLLKTQSVINKKLYTYLFISKK